MAGRNVNCSQTNNEYGGHILNIEDKLQEIENRLAYETVFGQGLQLIRRTATFKDVLGNHFYIKVAIGEPNFKDFVGFHAELDHLVDRGLLKVVKDDGETYELASTVAGKTGTIKLNYFQGQYTLEAQIPDMEE